MPRFHLPCIFLYYAHPPVSRQAFSGKSASKLPLKIRLSVFSSNPSPRNCSTISTSGNRFRTGSVPARSGRASGGQSLSGSWAWCWRCRKARSPAADFHTKAPTRASRRNARRSRAGQGPDAAGSSAAAAWNNRSGRRPCGTAPEARALRQPGRSRCRTGRRWAASGSPGGSSARAARATRCGPAPPRSRPYPDRSSRSRQTTGAKPLPRPETYSRHAPDAV